MGLDNSLAGAMQGDVGQTRDRNGNEHVRPQFESAFQPRY
jgi:hypothetical protein